MQAYQIQTADYLDILFEDKNKLYGAYELRRAYNNRLSKAMYATGFAITFGIILFYFSNQVTSTDKIFGDHPDIILEQAPENKPPEIPLPTPPPPPAPKVAMRAFTTPQIVVDQLVSEIEKPPMTEELEKTRIGFITQEGIEDAGIQAPPLNEGKGITEIPKPTGDAPEKTFMRVEIESVYPGGAGAWRRFLLKTLRYPALAQENNIQGNVTVKFIVDKEGKVSNVEAISGPDELRAEAVRVIQLSGKWTPAVQNGAKVKSYKNQAVVFAMDLE